MSTNKTRKLYVHIEDRKTCVLHDVGGDVTVSALCALVVKTLDLKGDNKLISDNLRAFSAKGRPLDPTLSIKRAIGKDLDVYLSLHSSRGNGSTKGTQGTSNSTAAASNTIGHDQKHHAQGIASRPEREPGGKQCHRKVQSPLVAPLLQKAAEKEALQHFKAAAFIYKQVPHKPTQLWHIRNCFSHGLAIQHLYLICKHCRYWTSMGSTRTA